MLRLFGLFAVIVGLGFSATAGWVIWRQMRDVGAPRDPGVCWRRDGDMKFVVLTKGSTSIEFCAGDLERIHMKTGEDLVGAYQGRYIFIDKEAIRSSDRMDGQHWRLYFDDQRRNLDKNLNARDMVFSTVR